MPTEAPHARDQGWHDRSAADDPTRAKLPSTADIMPSVLGLLREVSGVDFGAYKPGVIEGRIAKRLEARKLDDPHQYLDLLRCSPAELATLHQQVLIGVSSFFRDLEAFACLQSFVLPRLLAARSSAEPLRIWVAGCARGEEVYSILISLHDHLHRAGQQPGRPVQVLATDIDEDALAFARRGAYSRASLRGLTPEQRERYFVRHDDRHVIVPELRDAVVFARHDLCLNPPYSHLDLISCRNVLIYFERHVQQRVLQAFHYGLRSQGLLWLGHSESVGDAATLFSLLDGQHKLYARKRHASRSSGVAKLGPRAARAIPGETVAGAAEPEGSGAPPIALVVAAVPTAEQRCALLEAELACRLREIEVLNDELRARDREAESAERELSALLQALHFALVVDAGFRVCRWSPRSQGALAGLELQRNMDLAGLSAALHCPQLSAHVASAFETGLCGSAHVRLGSHARRLKIIPYGARKPGALVIITEAGAMRAAMSAQRESAP
jgi:chemotaxis methyl-accepting protein methylase